jgi:peptidoglycan/LPS O-acetylase OafA/YrhL
MIAQSPRLSRTGAEPTPSAGNENAPARAPGPAIPDKLGYVDAVRGWAILLVITCHVGGSIAGLPYPLHKLTNFGWQGVQLFFLASAVTLMMSWRRHDATSATAVRDFFLRRFLRIAPMYYAGALIYYVFEPPAGGFDLAQLLRALTFVNAWAPSWTPTTGDWMVVPGGWSIGVEFTFYALFPILASLITSMRRAILLFVVAFVAAVFANRVGAAAYAATDHMALVNFLYFWFPNQAPVFALGLVVYHALNSDRLPRLGRLASYGLLALAVGLSVVVAENPWKPEYFAGFTLAPPVLFATLAFMAFVYALAKGAPTLFTHVWMQRLGVLSFSCYVLHFLFVYELPTWTGRIVDVHATGLKAIVAVGLLWVLTLAATVAAATLTHQWIEKPGMRLARTLTARRKPAPVEAGAAG